MEKPCSCCREPRDSTGRYCRACRAAYMRQWRKDRPQTAVERMKSNARAYANVYLRRGKILRQPCRDCGSDGAEMHHPDYSKPIDVVWLCRPHHMAEHGRAHTPRETSQSGVPS